MHQSAVVTCLFQHGGLTSLVKMHLLRNKACYILAYVQHAHHLTHSPAQQPSRKMDGNVPDSIQDGCIQCTLSCKGCAFVSCLSIHYIISLITASVCSTCMPTIHARCVHKHAHRSVVLSPILSRGGKVWRLSDNVGMFYP